MVLYEYMAHTIENKEKLIMRIKRIRGQLNAAEKAIERDSDCAPVLHSLTACRGAMGSLIFEILEGHVHSHILDPRSKPDREQSKAAKDLIDVIKTYLK